MTLVQRTINGSANQVDWTFDALRRVTSEENLLGEFTYAYEGVTNRLSTVTHPNGQTSTYSYYNNAGDRRLETIHHKYPNTSTLSKFDYTYDVIGNILTWRQQADTSAVLWKYGYDQADQLISAVKESTATPATVLQRFAYAYDPAGNRTVEQVDDVVTLSAYDNLNRLTSQVPGGPMVIAGSLNEPGTVTISGVPAIVDANNNFRGTVPTTTGTNTFTIVAKDPTGDTTTQQYEVDVAGGSKTFTYDANGNLTSDGTRTFGWDANNAVVGVSAGGRLVEFERDGRGRMVRRTVADGSTVFADRTFLWCDVVLCAELDSIAAQETKRFDLGFRLGGVDRFVARDHLRSITVETDNVSAVQSRFSYDPFGRSTPTGSVPDLSSSFTNHQFDQEAGLYLTLTRSYDPQVGRWLSPDPTGMTDGPNLYAYVAGMVTTSFDPFGLQKTIGPMPPPSDAPEGCTAGPWKFISVAQQKKQSNVWKLVNEFSPSLLGPSGGRNSFSGRREFDDSTIGKCGCEWVLAKRIETNDVVRTWERAVQCGCGGPTNTQRVEQVKRYPATELPRIEPANGLRRVTYGWSLGSGCLCFPPPG